MTPTPWTAFRSPPEATGSVREKRSPFPGDAPDAPSSWTEWSSATLRNGIVSPDRRFFLLFDGQLRGHDALARHLAVAPHPVEQPAPGLPDSAWVLAAFRADPEHPERVAARLRGSWSLALWDDRRQQLSLAVDAFSRCRLYYGWRDRCFRCASRPEALWSAPDRAGDLDPSALSLYFRWHYLPPPLTPWRGLHKLPPGCLLTLTRETLAALPPAFSPWPRRAPDAAATTPIFHTPPWSPDPSGEEHENLADDGATATDDAVTELSRRLDEALADIRRLGMGSEGFGVLLSGGVDSALVAGQAARMYGSGVRAFSLSYANARELDESAGARQSAELWGLRHDTLRLDATDALTAAREALAAALEPYAAASLISLTALAHFAKRETDLCLTGDGGDELFAGYRRYAMGTRWARTVAGWPGSWRRLGGRLLGAMPSAGWDFLARCGGPLTPKAVHRRGGGVAARELACWLGSDSPVDFQARLLERGGEATKGYADETIQPVTEMLQALGSDGIDPVRLMMGIDQALYLPGDGVTKLTAASDASGLSLLPPLLDEQVADWSRRRSVTALFGPDGGKQPLKTLLRRRGGDAVVGRPKTGFDAPLTAWLTSPQWRDWLEATAGDTPLRAAGIDPETVRDWRLRTARGDRGAASRWWSVVAFMAWKDGGAGSRE